jgi:hypothetical protein
LVEKPALDEEAGYDPFEHRNLTHPTRWVMPLSFTSHITWLQFFIICMHMSNFVFCVKNLFCHKVNGDCKQESSWCKSLSDNQVMRNLALTTLEQCRAILSLIFMAVHALPTIIDFCFWEWICLVSDLVHMKFRNTGNLDIFTVQDMFNFENHLIIVYWSCYWSMKCETNIFTKEEDSSNLVRVKRIK